MKKYLWLIIVVAILSSCSSNQPPVQETVELVPHGTLYLIQPYIEDGRLYFDDANTRLRREGLTSGTDKILGRMCKEANIPDPENGYKLWFSDQPFPGYQQVMTWAYLKNKYNYYYCKAYDQHGGLCPQLFKYFDEAPQELYLRVEPRE